MRCTNNLSSTLTQYVWYCRQYARNTFSIAAVADKPITCVDWNLISCPDYFSECGIYCFASSWCHVNLDCEYSKMFYIVNSGFWDSLVVLLLKDRIAQSIPAAKFAHWLSILLVDNLLVHKLCGMQSSITPSVKLEKNNVPAFWPIWMKMD